MARTDSKELETLISHAIKKVGAGKENDICRYLPISTGGYIHHFTMRKMKHENPTELATMINKHIINASKPSKVTPKQRAARGSRKRRDQVVFSREDVSRLLNMARVAGDRDMVRKLLPNKDFKSARRELLASVRKGRVEQDLWDSYVEAVNHNSQTAKAR